MRSWERRRSELGRKPRAPEGASSGSCEKGCEKHTAHTRGRSAPSLRVPSMTHAPWHGWVPRRMQAPTFPPRSHARLCSKPFPRPRFSQCGAVGRRASEAVRNSSHPTATQHKAVPSHSPTAGNSLASLPVPRGQRCDSALLAPLSALHQHQTPHTDSQRDQDSGHSRGVIPGVPASVPTTAQHTTTRVPLPLQHEQGNRGTVGTYSGIWDPPIEAGLDRGKG